MIESLKLLALYLGNVVVLALPFAILEIWLEKFKSGWAGEFYNPFWGKKILTRFILSDVTVYHFVAFILALPTILLLEFFILWHMADSGFWILNVASVKLVPIIFLSAVWLGVTAMEDFLWFALNWRFPDALKRLLRGDVSWELGSVSITPSFKLPRFYFVFLFLAVLLAVAQFVLIHRF